MSAGFIAFPVSDNSICLPRPFGYRKIAVFLEDANIARPEWNEQNGYHFPDDILKCIFWNENVWISIKISLKFVPEGPINNVSALVQIMAGHRLGDFKAQSK